MIKNIKNSMNFIWGKITGHLDGHNEEEIKILKLGLEALEILTEKKKAIEELKKKNLGFCTWLNQRHKLEHKFNKKIRASKRGKFQWYHNKIKYTRFAFSIFNLFLFYILFRHIGFSFIGRIYMIVVVIGGISQVFLIANVEKRVIIPLKRLNEGVIEIVKGNYEVKVQCDKPSEVDMLIKSFNEMAKKLHEGEQLKHEYEENRKLLIANISHDLKTPITSIQGYIETIGDRDDVPKETLRKYHKTIYNNAAYMNKLIDDLFLFSKLDMQKLEFNFTTLSIKNFMEDLMCEFHFELEDRGVDFKYVSSLKEDYKVKIDINRINQVFRNIVGNAVKYGLEEEGKIEVELYKVGNGVEIGISDNGDGISEDKLPHVFDRFFRVDKARTKDLMSTGLGLAISKELVEAHGGNIKATSSKGVGTTFTIWLPIEK